MFILEYKDGVKPKELILHFTFCFLPLTSNVWTGLSIYCMIASSKRKEARA